MTLAELRTKEVIDVHDGKRLGRVMDIEFCTADSRVTALVVPAETSFLQSLRGEKCGLVPPRKRGGRAHCFSCIKAL